jgi:phage shock protein PspC (stress-responsive transcriptional regulator)
MIFGVCAGMGDYFGIDEVWIRLAFVLSAFAGGAGIIAYIVLRLIVPAGDDTTDAAAFDRQAERVARSMRGTPGWVGIALLVVGFLLVADQIWEWRPGIFWGIGLIVLGVFLFQRHDEPAQSFVVPADTTIVAPQPPTPSGAIEARHDVTTDVAAMSLPAPPSGPSRRELRLRRRRRERSPLGWIALGALTLIEGVISMLDMSDAIDVSLAQYLALALIVLGVGLLVGGWWGRARGLAVLGLFLTPFVLVASLIDVPFDGGFGDRRIRPASIEALRPDYHVVGGILEFDLRRITPLAGPVTVRATAVAGRIKVLVDADAPLEVAARVGAGEVILFGQTFDGVKIDVRRSFAAPSRKDAPATLTLDLETSLGVVEVISVERVRPLEQGVRS